MKIVILAGGNPSTISGEREGIPKPMALIGERPILWHIMKGFSGYGFNEFVICSGYKSETIKNYFADFYLYNSDITVDLQKNTIEIHKKVSENWKVTIVDTGLYTATGERINRIKNYIEEEDFIVTYGDCLSDLNISEVLKEHSKSDKIATMVVASPTGRNELVSIDCNNDLFNDSKDVNGKKRSEAWTDANIYVFSNKIFSYLHGNYRLEEQLFKSLIQEKQMHVYKHRGFWMPVETVRDRSDMENLWNAGMAPWKVWK